MFQKTFLPRLLVIFVLVTLLAAALPVPMSQAQGGLSDEELALFQRAVDAVNEAAAYSSYAFTSAFDLAITWRAYQNGAEVAGVDDTFTRAEDAALVRTGARPNIQRAITMTDSFIDLTGNTYNFIIDAEVRQVDGTVYANAAYTEVEGDNMPEMPDAWVTVESAAALQVWPGVGVVLGPQELEAAPGMEAVFIPFLALSQGQLDTMFANITTISASDVTLDDGTPAQAIAVTLDAAGVRPLEMFFSADPIDQRVAGAAAGDILTYMLYVDEAGRLRGIDYSFAYALEDVDIGGVSDVPEGVTLNIENRQTYTSRFTDINAVETLAAAPEIAGQEALVGFLPPELDSDLPWWNDRVFYEVFVRSFFDSDDDGIGDLQGLIAKLDYLNDGDPATTGDLGVTGLWLMPIAQSPSYHGYDTTDYYTIEEDYGTNADFLQLVEEAHARGMVVLVDLVLNHTSNEHPWFQAALAGDAEYEDYYIWAAEDPGWRAPWGAPAWHEGDNGLYYFGMFWEGMPDLNYETPAVNDAMNDVIRFWLEEMGADGFRLDAIRHLIEDGPVMENTPATLNWLEDFDAYVHDLNPAALTVGEIWDETADAAPYVTGDRVDIAFEFDLATTILLSVQLGVHDLLYADQNAILEAYPQGQYAAFLTNHDQNRVMSQLNGDLLAAKLAATLLLTNPGVPFIYYGEEIGMVGEKPDERIRTPMQWDSTRARGGFTNVAPWQSLQFGYSGVNVALQDETPDSLLNHYRALVHLRNNHDALRSGPMQLVAATDAHVYSFLRYGAEEALLVVVNLGDDPVSDYVLAVPASHLRGELSAELLLGEGDVAAPDVIAPALSGEGALIDYTPLETLPPQSSYIIRLQ